MPLAEGLGLPERRFLVAHRTGCLRLAQGDVVAARRELEDAVRTAETLRGAIAHRSLRTGFLLGRAEAHTDLVRLLLGSGDADDELAAFLLSDRTKRLTSHTSGDLSSSDTELVAARPLGRPLAPAGTRGTIVRFHRSSRTFAPRTT